MTRTTGSPSVARIPGRRLVAVALTLVVALSIAPVAAQTDPSGGDSPAGPTMALAARSPWVEPGGALDLDLSLGGTLDAASVQVLAWTPVDSVEALARSANEDVGRQLYRSPRVGIGIIPLLPDGNRRFTVPTSVGPDGPLTARLDEPGIYPVEVRLYDGGDVVESIRTPVVRLGTADDPLPAPDLDVIVDVTAGPTLQADGTRQLDDDDLDRLGRVAGLLAGDIAPLTGPLTGPAPDVSVAAHADTLDALAATDDPRADRVIAAIGAGGQDRTLLGLPAVPLSAAALVDAGLDGFLAALQVAGRTALADRFDLDVDAATWDGTAGIDEASAEVLAGVDVARVLLDAPEAVDSAAADRALVPAGPVAVDALDPLEAVLVDRQTSQALLDRAADRADAGHVALAELLARDDGLGSTVVLRFDDAPDDSVLVRLLPLLLADGSPVALGPLEVGGGGRDEDSDVEDPVGDAGPGEDGDDEADDDQLDLPDATVDLTDIADRVREVASSVSTFSTMVMAESARGDQLGQRIATAIAVGVDDDRRQALLDAVASEVDGAFGAVSLAGQTDLNLTSRSGTLPLMIRNDNGFPVEVVLRIRSERLAFPDGDRFVIPVTEEVMRVDVPVEALATGSVPTFVDLLTPDEEVVLDRRQLNVRSTAISGVGLTLSLGALAVLVIWWARTWRRSRRDKSRSD